MEHDTVAIRDLDPAELRVLGALLEKERTVPGSYPMTLNGLRGACNQTSGRDPILSLSDGEVSAALEDLRARKLTRVIHASHGARVVKYRQVLDEVLDLDDAERAVVTLLLLRGPQTPGEIRNRAERLHAFDELAEVERALGSLAGHAEPLVQELERRPGQKERRWTHLLGSADVGGEAGPMGSQPLDRAAASTGGTESVLDQGSAARDRTVSGTYDAVATDYAENFAGELDAKPLDRWLLERLAGLAQGGPVADAGCGPGHVAFHLAAAGAEVTGFDLSTAMVAEARRRYPELSFEVADLRSLPTPPDGAWAAIAAWYSLVHLADSELAPAVRALTSVLASGGWLVLGVHVGSEVRRVQEWWGHAVDLRVVLHDPAVVLAAVEAAGLVDVEWYRRGPQDDREAQTERLYVLARKP